MSGSEQAAPAADAGAAEEAASAAPKARAGKGGWPKGKPRKEAADAAQAAAEEAAPADEAPSEKPRPRKKKPTRDDVAAAARRLVGLHVLMANMFQAPELQISPEEAESLVTSTNDLADEFGIEMPAKLGAIVAFIGTTGAVYLPRLAHWRFRMMQEAAKRRNMNGGAGDTIQPDGSPYVAPEPQGVHGGH